MKMYNILRQYSAIVGVLFFVIVLSVVCTYHWSTQTVAAQNKVITKSKGLTLSPLRNEIEIAPGTSLDGVLTVTNSTKKPMTVSMNAEAFSVINQQYDYAFNADSQISKWLEFDPSQINLLAGESKTVTYTIGVPIGAEPGGRYISMFASNDTENTDSGISSRQRIASLVYLTVMGDVTRDGHLISLASPLFVGETGSWSLALQNTGTTHFRSRYNINIQNLLGNDVAASSAGDALILPGTVRSLAGDLPSPKFPGIYKIIYTIGLGDTPAVVVTKYEVYLPPVFSASLIAIGVVVMISWKYFKPRRKT